MIRFGLTTFDDLMSQLKKHVQTIIVDIYKTQFEFLSNWLRGLDENIKLSYISKWFEGGDQVTHKAPRA